MFGCFSHPQNPLRITYTGTMAMNLLELNDDVLVEIFHDFSLTELIGVASTCSRLRTIARRVFTLRYNTEYFDIGEALLYHSNLRGRHRAKLATFRIFGDLFTKLKVSFSFIDINMRAFNSIVMYCSRTLEGLELNDCRCVSLYTFIDATALYQNLKELSLEGWATDFMKFLSHDYPKLRTLKLDSSCDDDVNVNGMANFMKRHTNLIEINLRHCRAVDISWIVELPQLRSLKYHHRRQSTVNLQPITLFENLKTLIIQNEIVQVEEFLEKSMSYQSLETLAFSCSKSYMVEIEKRFMLALMRFTNLQYLRIQTYIHFDDINLAHFHQLEKLRELNITGNFAITGNGLVNLVLHLPLLELLCLDAGGGEYKRIQLLKSTLSRIGGICRGRNQKLKIWNAGEECRRRQETSPSHFDGDEHGFVHFFPSEKDYDEDDEDEIILENVYI